MDTETLIKGLRSGVIRQAGLDVYENEAPYFFKDCSNTPVQVSYAATRLSLVCCPINDDVARVSQVRLVSVVRWVQPTTPRELPPSAVHLSVRCEMPPHSCGASSPMGSCAYRPVLTICLCADYAGPPSLGTAELQQRASDGPPGA